MPGDDSNDHGVFARNDTAKEVFTGELICVILWRDMSQLFNPGPWKKAPVGRAEFP